MSAHTAHHNARANSPETRAAHGAHTLHTPTRTRARNNIARHLAQKKALTCARYTRAVCAPRALRWFAGDIPVRYPVRTRAFYTYTH